MFNIYVIQYFKILKKNLNRFYLKAYLSQDLMIGALVSESSDPASSPDRGCCAYYWAKHFTLILPLST